MTNDLLVSSIMITPMPPAVCTPESLGAYTPMSPGVSAPVLSSVIKPESLWVPMPVSPGLSSPHSSARGVNHLILTIIFLFHSRMPLLVSVKFQMGWIGNLLVHKIFAIHAISTQFFNVSFQ